MVDAANRVLETTTARFRSEVLEESMRRLVLVDFWAPWCEPCKQLAPTLEKIAAAAGDLLTLAKMNIEAEPEVADQLGIKSIPAVVAFQHGRPVDGFVGALPESEIRGFLERLVGPIDVAEDPLTLAQALLAEGDIAGAHALLSELASADPPNPAAIAALAGLYVTAQQFDQAHALLARLPESARARPDVAAVAAALDNATKAADLGEIGDLRTRIGLDPDDLNAYFDLALALNARNEREEAAHALLEIIRRDRSWREDGARKQLLQFFEAWGPMDKAAISARRKLSTLLFS
jgi:putative thioredoxin